jgi:mRNA interferase HicA
MLDGVGVNAYDSFKDRRKGGAVKQSEFVRWLIEQGVSTKNAKRHVQLNLNGKTSHLPRHPAKELATGTVEAVKKQLGLK